MTGIVKVSHATFNELAAALEKVGIQINNPENPAVTISKGTTILPPIDMRMATMRRDCLAHAVTYYHVDDKRSIVEIANQMFEFVLNGKVKEDITKNPPTLPKSGW